jgi:hypothetical protein
LCAFILLGYVENSLHNVLLPFFIVVMCLFYKRE